MIALLSARINFTRGASAAIYTTTEAAGATTESSRQATAIEDGAICITRVLRLGCFKFMKRGARLATFRGLPWFWLSYAGARYHT